MPPALTFYAYLTTLFSYSRRTFSTHLIEIDSRNLMNRRYSNFKHIDCAVANHMHSSCERFDWVLFKDATYVGDGMYLRLTRFFFYS